MTKIEAIEQRDSDLRERWRNARSPAERDRTHLLTVAKALAEALRDAMMPAEARLDEYDSDPGGKRFASWKAALDLYYDAPTTDERRQP